MNFALRCFCIHHIRKLLRKSRADHGTGASMLWRRRRKVHWRSPVVFWILILRGMIKGIVRAESSFYTIGIDLFGMPRSESSLLKTNLDECRVYRVVGAQ